MLLFLTSSKVTARHKSNFSNVNIAVFFLFSFYITDHLNILKPLNNTTTI